MKRLLSALFLIFSFAYTALAQDTKASNVNSLLWEISGKGVKNVSYLFGTIHMIHKDDYILTDVTKEAFEKAKRVTFEINMEEMSDMSAMLPLMMRAFMQNGTTLKDLLSEDEYTVVKNHFEEMGLPMMMLERIKPMFLSALASEDMMGEDSGMGMGDIVSYEMELMDMATDREMEVAGLETAEFQMSMFDSIPYEAQAKMLLESIKAESGEEDDQLKIMVEMYKNQDIEGMQQMIQGDEEGIGKYEELLLIQRNKNWIPVMAQMMTQMPTFFAVGAGHLGGEQGVIALLREAGYTLKPIK